MENGKGRAEDELRQLLRVGSGLVPAEKVPRAAIIGESADLQALIRECSSGSLPQRRPVYASEGEAGASLQDLLRAPAVESLEKSARPRLPGDENSPETPALSEILRAVQGRSLPLDPPVRSVLPRRAVAADLGSVLSATHAHQAPAEMPVGRASPWLVRAAWASALFVLIGLALWWPVRRLDGPAGTLQDLAQAVEHDYRTQGHLPDQLSRLEGFPKGAVEWPVKYWRARDAAGRTEIIWMPNGGRHYRIVLRQGDEVWYYQDKDGKAHLVTQGKP